MKRFLLYHTMLETNRLARRGMLSMLRPEKAEAASRAEMPKESKECKDGDGDKWRFPKIGVPLNHPFEWDFHEINQPIWVTSFMETPSPGVPCGKPNGKHHPWLGMVYTTYVWSWLGDWLWLLYPPKGVPIITHPHDWGWHMYFLLFHQPFLHADDLGMHGFSPIIFNPQKPSRRLLQIRVRFHWNSFAHRISCPLPIQEGSAMTVAGYNAMFVGRIPFVWRIHISHVISCRLCMDVCMYIYICILNYNI